MMVIQAAIVLVLAAAANSFSQLAHSPWPMRGHDVGHSGQSAFRGAQIGAERWQFQTRDAVYSSPTIGADGVIYVGSLDGHLYAINTDGSERWRFKTGGKVYSSSPAISADGVIYVGSRDGLYAVNIDGSKRWRFGMEGGFSSPAIGADGAIYVGSGDGHLYAVNVDGSERWRFQTGEVSVPTPVRGSDHVVYVVMATVFSSPAIGADGVIYVGAWDYNLYAINADGSERWRFLTGDAIYSSPSVGADGIIHVGSSDSNLYAVNVDGSERWRFQVGDSLFSSPVIGTNGVVYVGCRDNHLYAVNVDGSERWQFRTGGNVDSSPAIDSDGVIYVGSDDGHLYAINDEGSERWRFRIGGNVDSSPAIGANGVIHVGSGDGHLFAIGDPPFEIVARHPVADEMGVDPNTSISAQFSRPVLIPEDILELLSVTADDRKVGIEISGIGPSLEIQPVAPFPPGAEIRVEISSRLEDAWHGESLAEPVIWTFTVGEHTPSVEISSIEGDEGEIRIDYSSIDPENNRMETWGWQFSLDEVSWLDVDTSAIENNSPRSPGENYLLWNTQSGTHSLEGVDTNSLYFRMKVKNSAFSSAYDVFGPFSIDNNQPPSVMITPLIEEQTGTEVDIHFEVADPEGDEVAVTCEFSIEGEFWSPATVSGNTEDLATRTSHQVTWAIGTDTFPKFDDKVSFRVTPRDRDTGTVGITLIHVDFNELPSVQLEDIYEDITGSVDINYELLDPEGDTLSVWIEYSLDSGVTWLPGTVFSDTTGIVPIAYLGTVTWLAENDLSEKGGFRGVRVRLTPRDNDWGFADDTIDFQLNPASPPRLLEARGTMGEREVVLTFSEPVDFSSALDLGYYSLSGGLTVDSLSADSLSSSAPWPMRGHDVRHTGQSAYRGAQAGSERWRFQMGDDVNSSPSIGADGVIYVGSRDSLYAINPVGSVRWRFNTGNHSVSTGTASSPSIGADGIIYAGSKDDHLYAINADGSERWRFKTGDNIDSSPSIGADGAIYVGSWDGYLYAVNVDGSERWRFKTERGIWSSPAIGADGVFYVGSLDGHLYAINTDGSERWRFKTGGEVYSSPAISADGVIYVGSWDDNLHAVNADGSERWRFKTGGGVSSSPAIGVDGVIYVGSFDNHLYAINADGSERWRFKTGDYVTSSLAIDATGVIYVGALDGHLYAVNGDGSERWHFPMGGKVSSPAIGADGTIYVSSRNNLYAVGDSNAVSLYAGGYSILLIIDQDLPNEQVIVSIHGLADLSGNVMEQEQQVVFVPEDLTLPPALFVQDQRLSVPGIVEVNYQLTDAEEHTISLELMFSTDSGNSWQTGEIVVQDTLGNTLSPDNLDSGGYRGLLIWDSYAVLPSYMGEVQVRLTPRDRKAGESHTFILELNNNALPQVVARGPSDEQLGDVSIGYKLSDVDNDTLSLIIEYTLDLAVGDWQTATVEGLETAIGEDQYSGTLAWRVSDDLGEIHSDVFVRLTPVDTRAGVSDTLAVRLNTAGSPSMTLTSPQGEQQGQMELSFQVIDPDGSTVRLVGDYSIDSGKTWNIAEGIEVAEFGPDQYQASLTWNSVVDLPGFDGDVALRLTPHDAREGIAAAVDDIRVDNNFPPEVVPDNVSGVVAGQAEIGCELRDAEGDMLGLRVEFSTDGGNTWNTPSMETDLSTIEPGHQVFRWNTLEDLGNSVIQQVQFRFTAADADTGESAISQFTVQNLLGDADHDGWVGFSDVSSFSQAWHDNDLAWDIGPAGGEFPVLQPMPDSRVDFEDLTVFVRLWYWSSAQHPAGRIAVKAMGPALDNWLSPLEIPGNQTVHHVVPAPPLPEARALRLRWEIDPELLSIVPADTGAAGGMLRLSQQGEGWVELQQAMLEVGKKLESHWKVRILVDELEIDVQVEYEILDHKRQLLARGQLMQSVRSTRLPETFALRLAAPNPFNPETTIRYEVPEVSRVILEIYNVAGQRVRVLREEDHVPGYHQIIWDGQDQEQRPLGSGVYLVTMRAGGFRQVVKVLLLQ
jgi:outer membrane protein assembly factor BamB